LLICESEDEISNIIKVIKEELKIFGMKIEVSKTKILRIGKSQNLSETVRLDLDGDTMTCAKEMKWLGFFFEEHGFMN
jgi:hypothetical protein